MHNYKTPKTACVQTILLKHPTKLSVERGKKKKKKKKKKKRKKECTCKRKCISDPNMPGICQGSHGLSILRHLRLLSTYDLGLV